MFRRLQRLPFELKVALITMIGGICLNVLWAISQWGAKIDPGLATLVGAIIGLTIVGHQARRGFSNLLRSQAHQAELDREARIHQAALDRLALDSEHDRNKAVLLHGLWAEIISLDADVRENLFNVKMFAEMHKSYIKEHIQNQTKGISFKSHDAPYFKANIPNLGVLGPSLGADIIKVLSRADGRPHLYAKDVVLSNETLLTMYDGNADALMNWRDELAHVAARIHAVVHDLPDPGSLASTAKQRKETMKERHSKVDAEYNAKASS